ncbi:MAG: hypothetical protein QOE54_691 [Streptosporangiaceae bacterium]|nr:hypothetical protein [Streptosporangiaceae bacterium]
MAVQIWRRRRTSAPALDPATDTPTDTAADTRTRPRLFPRRTADEAGTARPRIFTGRRVAEAKPQTVLVDKKTARRWRRHRRNPVSTGLWMTAVTAALILALGMLLTWSNANQANEVVHAIMRTGAWLATPFHDVFANPDPKHQMYENWAVAAGVYLIIGRALSWLTRW